MLPKLKIGALVCLKSNPEVQMVICKYLTTGRKNFYYHGYVICKWLDSNGNPQQGKFPEDGLSPLD